MPRSKGHHQVPQWLLKHFCHDDGKTLWVGSKDTRDVRPVNVRKAFLSNDANSRIDYQPREDGTFLRKKSDPDEKILAAFDGKAAPVARKLIRFARERRQPGTPSHSLSTEDMELCKLLIVVQARRTLESQDRTFLGQDNREILLGTARQLARQHGQPLPSNRDLLQKPGVVRLLDDLSQNQRANFASGDHPILKDKETEFLVPLGMHIAVTTAGPEFIISTHGVTVMEPESGHGTWLPLAPDVAISLSDQPGTMGIGICRSELVQRHNLAALALSARVAGRSRDVMRELLGIPV